MFDVQEETKKVVWVAMGRRKLMIIQYKYSRDKNLLSEQKKSKVQDEDTKRTNTFEHIANRFIYIYIRRALLINT